MASLAIRGVTKRFGDVQALTGVDLDVPEGSLTAVLGPSGCGKTTLLRLVAGFTNPDSGTIAIGGDVVADAHRCVPPQRRRVGYLPQEGALFPHLNVAANVAFGLSRADRSARYVAEMLELVGLNYSFAHRYPHELSGGQQQRVALARALAPRPSIVLLDEPFSSLDAGLRLATARAVAGAVRAAGTTAVLVTHDQDEALSLADQVAVLHDGRVAQVGPPSTVYTHPADPTVAAFVGAAVLLPATVAGLVARCSLGEVPVPPGTAPGSAQLLIRPEQIRLDAPDGVPARVLEVSYFGHDATVALRVEKDGTQIVARIMGTPAPPTESLVRVGVTGPVVAYPAAG